MYHKLGVLHKRNLMSYTSGSSNFKNKVLAGLVNSGVYEEESVPVSPLCQESLAFPDGPYRSFPLIDPALIFTWRCIDP